MRGESWKHTRFLLRCFKESEETHRKRCFLKVAVYIFRTLQPHWRTSCSLLCKYNARFEITASGAMWLVLAEPGLNIHCALSTPRIQNCAALSPECDYAVPQCWHERCRFPFTRSPKARLRSCTWVHLILFQIKSLHCYLLTCAGNMQILALTAICERSDARFH